MTRDESLKEKLITTDSDIYVEIAIVVELLLTIRMHFIAFAKQKFSMRFYILYEKKTIPCNRNVVVSYTKYLLEFL